MKLIYLSTGEAVKVDDADYEWLSKHKWYAKASAYNIYAVRTVYECGETLSGSGSRYQTRRTLRMHREITQCGPNKEIDHKDGNTLNNQRDNLEIVDKTVNIFREQRPLFRPNNHKPLTPPQ